MKTRYLAALTLALLIGVQSAAAQEDPRHPLSQVHPVDVDLNMSDQDVFNVSELRFNDGLGETGLVLNNYRLRDETNSYILRLDDSEGDWEIIGSDLNLSDNTIEEVGNLSMTGNIDLNGNNITEIDTLHFETGMQINGSINTSGGSANFDGGSINDVDSIDGGGDAVTFDDDIDLNGNNLIEPNEIQTGGQNIQVVNNTGSDIARFKDNGDIEVPNGDLSIKDNSLTGNNGYLTFEGSWTQLRADNVFRVEDSSGNPILRVDTNGGNVEIPNGDLNVSSGDVVAQDGSGSDPGIGFHNDGDTGIYRSTDDQLRIAAGGSDFAQFGVSNTEFLGNVGLDGNILFDVGGTTDASSGAIRLSNTATIQARNNANDGDIVMLETDSSDDVNLASGGRHLKFEGSGGINVAGNHIRSLGGTTDASSGAIRLANNADITFRNNADNGDVVGLSVDTSDNIELPGGNVEIPNGNLNMKDNNITNFFDSSCPASHAVVQVYKDGTYQCMNVTEEVSDHYVDRDGDSMDGDLDMQGNDILDVEDLRGNNANQRVRFGSNEGVTVFQVDNSGSEQTQLRMHGGDDLEIKNVPLNFADSTNIQDSGKDVIQFDGSRNVKLPNGYLNMSGNNIRTDGGWLSNDGDNEGVYVDTSGDVGVGTSNPSSRLEVSGGNAEIPDGNLDVGSPSNTGGTLDVGGQVNVDGDIDTNGNSVKSSGGEVCVGDQCT